MPDSLMKRAAAQLPLLQLIKSIASILLQKVQSAFAGEAPSYVTAAAGRGRPYGKNLTRGGFDSRETVRNRPEVGSKDAPAREAERTMY